MMLQTIPRTGVPSGTSHNLFVLSPVDWAYFAFPIPAEGVSVISIDWLMDSLNEMLDLVTEADTSILQRVLHVAHILVTIQGIDRLWPSAINVMHGCNVGDGRSSKPVQLFVRLKAMLDTSEFDVVISSILKVNDRS